VEQVRVREGDTVDRGALLVRLGGSDVRAQHAAALTALEAAVATERRTNLLVAGGYAPPSALDLVRAQRAQAEGQAAAMREALAYTEVRAPFAGVVLTKLVSAGDLVSPGQPMLELSGKGLEIVALASESESRVLAVGLRLPFESAGARGEAIVTAVSPGGDPASHRGIVRARLASGGDGLRSGDFARLQLPASSGAPRLSLPRSAVVERGDLTGVFLAAAGKAELRWIAAGDAEGDAVAIRAGLRAGDEVIDAPGALRDGDPVEVSLGR